MEKTFIGVRDVDKEAFTKLRAVAIARRINLGEALTLAINTFVNEQKETTKKRNLKRMRKLFGVKPVDFREGSEKLSKQIDELLYR